MKLPFYLRKSKLYFKDGKWLLDIKMNWFDKLCLLIVMFWRNIKNE